MNRNDTVQYGFRLNLKNPNHLLVHNALMNLDPEVYKSKSMFITDCLIGCLGGTGRDPVGSGRKEERVPAEEYVTRREMEELKENLERDLSRKVLMELMTVLIGALSGQGARSFRMPDNAMYQDGESEALGENQKEAEKTLRDLSDMWSDE